MVRIRADASIAKNQAGCADFAKSFQDSARRLQFDAKEYVYLPFVHGFEIQGPVNICYMALCRWEAKGTMFEFDWGKRTFFRIIKPNSDPMQNELYGVFASTFDRHWGVNSEASFHLDSRDG